MQSINLAKAVPTILEDALKAAGWNITESTATGIAAYKAGIYLGWVAGKGLNVTGYYPQETVTAITKAYSKQAVTWAAKRAGWTVQQTAGDKLTVTRR
ncbi:MAG: hypothetical protein A2Y76_01575 [Planctomycetes bacterium RBG_13_60_9]|nr:MAG: hypothetical protein A2Y76_01575 [Planctomycetes bacterium RBG_13_60_9]